MWPGPFDRAYPAENVAPLVSSQTSRTIKPYFSFNMLNAIFFIPGNENFDQFIGFFRNWFCLIFNLLLLFVQKRMDITDSGGSVVSWSVEYKPSNQAWNMIYLMITCRLPLHETPGLFFFTGTCKFASTWRRNRQRLFCKYTSAFISVIKSFCWYLCGFEVNYQMRLPDDFDGKNSTSA